ncbi:hypothetical protein GQ457_02G022220 [Hibiscus cannabinus]
MFAASFGSKMGCLYSVFNVKKQEKPVWVVRTRNWKLRGVENRLSGLLEGVSIVSSGRQGSKGDRQWGGYALLEEQYVLFMLIHDSCMLGMFWNDFWYRYQGRVSVPKPHWVLGIDTGIRTFGFDSGIPRVIFSGRSCDWTGSRGLHDVSVIKVRVVIKARVVVKYVRSSPARLQKFKACAEEEKINSKSLVCLDIETWWNSTFSMLKSALVFRKAFKNLKTKYLPYKKELQKVGGATDDEDWDKITSFLPFLRIFYETTLSFSRSRYVTENTFVEEIYDIGYTINHYVDDLNDGIKSMA